MPNFPRWIKPDSAYCEVQRTVDRCLLFKPDESTRHIIGSAAGRALIKFPVKIYYLDFNINHKQNGIAPLSDDPHHIRNYAKFHQLFNSLLARGINRLLNREGAIYSSRNRSTEAVDDHSLEQQLFYAVTNPVKDGLVERVAHWKGFSSYKQLATGQTERFTYIDWSAWHKAGGKRNRKSPGQFVKTVEVKLTPIPAWEHMTEPQRQAHFRREVRKLEQRFREERELEGRSVMGPRHLEKLDHRGHPKRPAERTRKPLCHASTLEGAKEHRERMRAFLDEYYKASELWRLGVYEVEFPRGSFKPPDIRAVA
jgi:hypothetical protein